MLAGEGSEVDRSKGRSKRQKERERQNPEGGAGRRIRQQPIRLARPHVDAHFGVRPLSREIRLEDRDESEE